MNTSRAAMLQSAADDIGIIADTVEELVRLLDKVFNQYGDEITGRLEQVWPSHVHLGPYVAKELHRLADRLAPPEA